MREHPCSKFETAEFRRTAARDASVFPVVRILAFGGFKKTLAVMSDFKEMGRSDCLRKWLSHDP
jgi:hypothetical protein